MSGGHYDYAYTWVERFTDKMARESAVSHSAPRARLAGILEDVAAAMHAVEWVDSGDWVPGDEESPIARLTRFEDAIRAHKAEFDRLKLNPDPADFDLWAVIEATRPDGPKGYNQ